LFQEGTAISAHILQRERELKTGALAEVNFPDYGTVLWSSGSRNILKKALRLQHLSCQKCENSGWRMRIGAIS
jgi:hypothetical protein